MFVPPRYSEDEARAAIAASRSYAEALRRLDMCDSGGAWRVLQQYANEIWGIPVDHFDPAAAPLEGLAKYRFKAAPLEEVLVAGRPFSRSQLKERLYAAGLKERTCELCGQGESWRERRMSLILDHVNGVRDDNRLENLRIVCPNCAATLDTHCGRNKGRIPDQRVCEVCGTEFRPTSAGQRHCSSACGSRHRNRPQRGKPAPERRKFVRPSQGQLLDDVASLGYLGTGRKYGVSDNAIRKWLTWYRREREEAMRAEATGAGADTGAHRG